MKGKIYIKTVPSLYEDGVDYRIGEVVEILSNNRGDGYMVICDKEDSEFFIRDVRYCMRIKSLDDPTPYFDNKKKS